MADMARMHYDGDDDMIRSSTRWWTPTKPSVLYPLIASNQCVHAFACVVCFTESIIHINTNTHKHQCSPLQPALPPPVTSIIAYAMILSRLVDRKNWSRCHIELLAVCVARRILACVFIRTTRHSITKCTAKWNIAPNRRRIVSVSWIMSLSC